jgi:hypothetical protein
MVMQNRFGPIHERLTAHCPVASKIGEIRLLRLSWNVLSYRAIGCMSLEERPDHIRVVERWVDADQFGEVLHSTSAPDARNILNRLPLRLALDPERCALGYVLAANIYLNACPIMPPLGAQRQPFSPAPKFVNAIAFSKTWRGGGNPALGAIVLVCRNQTATVAVVPRSHSDRLSDTPAHI